MGADIHGVYQTRFKCYDGEMSEWQTVGEIEDERNYWLFSALAGVRNYNNFEKVADLRGLPEDFELGENECVKIRYSAREVWMGEHSQTWYTTKELLEWSGWDQESKLYGPLRSACELFLAFLRYIDLKNDEVRIVIGFDN